MKTASTFTLQLYTTKPLVDVGEMEQDIVLIQEEKYW